MSIKDFHSNKGTYAGDPSQLRDLSDFCQHWPSLRDAVSEESLQSLDVPDDVRQILVWLVRLADRVHRDEGG
ncbi:hypothetical protein [Pelagibius marinus]|uniref:hypothetical protein n=1 Tax=Pelagibius marinus TaxID=2762760 RepID=UPI0018730265|nr:hypothetical protein [Pelagibius marinus]